MKPSAVIFLRLTGAFGQPLLFLEVIRVRLFMLFAWGALLSWSLLLE